MRYEMKVTEIEITYRVGDYFGDGTCNHIWAATAAGSTIGEIYVSTDRHEIMSVEVDEHHRGEGVARALYETADSRVGVFHAPAAHRTPEGNAFALAVGGETVEPYPCTCCGCSVVDEEDELASTHGDD